MRTSMKIITLTKDGSALQSKTWADVWDWDSVRSSFLAKSHLAKAPFSPRSTRDGVRIPAERTRKRI